MSVELEPAKSDQKLVGDVLGNRYQIEKRLGEGAMGTVYRAKHVKMGRAFAVKVLHPHLLVDDKITQRFEREAELAGRLRHANVIGVVDVGETNDGLRYMVMDFAEGPDLATLMEQAPMPPERVIHLTRQLLEGLFHAHERGLIHRDFKPENVIVEKDTHGAEVPRIVDFGIAILREGGGSTDGPGRLTTNGLVLGTPHYMAPEQAVADPIDHRIDLFALGIIVYEMLCGKLPFDGSGAEVARANLLLDPPPMAERVPNIAVDPLLEAFARRLMAKKRDHRPETAKAARDLLDLIGRDRDAAATALGVKPSAARLPINTVDAAPVRPHVGDGTFPPPIREATAPTQLAPTLPSPHVTTQSLAPVKRRTPMIAAAIAGVAVLGVAAVVTLRGSGPKPPASETLVAAPEPTVEAPTPVEVPTPVETDDTTATTDTPSNIESTADTRANLDAVRDQPSPGSNAEPTTAKTVKPPPKTVKTPATTKPTPAVAKVEPKPDATKPATTGPMTANTLAAQYQTVGAQLKALQAAKGPDAVSDLWARYRMIRLADALATQPKRDDAAAILAKLATEIAARKK
jgi:serine/threonine-protein kinase